MKSKKGFTLVEIIVCLVLILLVSGSFLGIVLYNKNKKEEKVLEVTKKIQEAAGVYLAINKEIDDTIEQNILNGGSGYVISLRTLLDAGYIGDNHIKTLEDNGVVVDPDKDYMLAAVFSNTNHCDNNESTITIEASYQLENSSNYYLCNFTTEKNYLLYDLDGGNFTDNSPIVELFPKGSNIKLKSATSSLVKKDNISNIKYNFKEWNTKKNCAGTTLSGNMLLNDNKVVYACYDKQIMEKKVTLKEMMKSANFSNNIGKAAVSKEWCDNNSHNDDIVCNENGLFIDRDKTNGVTYYYFRGAVENNYVKLADKLWRILWINSENKVKLILDDSINLKVTNLDGNSIELGKDSTVLNMYIADIQNRPNDSSILNRSYKSPVNYYILNQNDQNKSIIGSFSKCSASGVNCGKADGSTYRFTGEYLYENLNKSTYIQGNFDNWTTENILTFNLYDDVLTSLTNSLTSDSVFNNVVPNNLSWYYYKTNYDNSKSVYYRKNGCYCNWSSSCCYNNNFPTSYEIDENSYTKYTYKNGKIGYINYHELRMAGLTTTTVANSDNFLVKDNNSNFLIAEYNREHSSEWDEESLSERYYGLRWYYVNGINGNISDYQFVKRLKEYLPQDILVRSYNQNLLLDSCSSYIRVSGYNKCNGTSNRDGTLIFGSHAYDYAQLYNFTANSVRPVVELKLGDYKLSDNEGIKTDPYILVK